MSGPGRIELHINQIVLDGIECPPWHRRDIREAIQGELTRLIVAGTIDRDLKRTTAADSIQVRTADLDAATTPQRLGVEIAGSAYEGIGRVCGAGNQ